MSKPQSKRKAKINPRTQPVPMSSWVATTLLTCLWAILFGLVTGVFLSVTGKLPSLVTGIASGIYGVGLAVVTVLVAIFGTVGSEETLKSSFRRVWGSAHRRLSPIFGIVIVTIVTLPLVFFNQSSGGAIPNILSSTPSV